MSVTHIARFGKTYHLLVSKTPAGKEKFFLSTKTDGVLAKQIPEGFEIYETVNSMVFLRRKTASIIQENPSALGGGLHSRVLRIAISHKRSVNIL